MEKQTQKAMRTIVVFFIVLVFISTVSALAKTNLDADQTYSITNALGNEVSVWANMVPNPGNGQCWAYANSIYEIIWGVNFASSFAGSNSAGYNTLRELSASERTMTAENVKRFITQAALGASIRITACTEVCTNFKSDSCKTHDYGHNLILVAKSDTGFVAIHRGNARQCTQYTWSSFVNAWPKYTYFKYIKYPGAMSIEWTITPLSGTYEFIEDNESRHDCYESSPLVCRYSVGDRVEVNGRIENGGGNTWYRLADGSYIFSGDVKEVTCRHERYCCADKCILCEEVYDGVNMFHIGDEILEPAIAVTCTADGKTEGRVCSMCGEILIQSESIPATGHTEGEWLIVTEATDTTEGLMALYCEVCDALLDKKIIPICEIMRLAGDINQDSIVDGRDLLSLARYIAGYDEILNINADVTGDEIVDGRDIVRLAKYIAGYQVVLE